MGHARELGRPTYESLSNAAAELRRVSETNVSDHWLGSARAAVRTAAVAIEQELGALAASDGLSNKITDDEPRLIPSLEKLQASLSATLVELWEGAAGGSAELGVLAKRVQALAEQTFSLIHELYTSSPAAID